MKLPLINFGIGHDGLKHWIAQHICRHEFIERKLLYYATKQDTHGHLQYIPNITLFLECRRCGLKRSCT